MANSKGKVRRGTANSQRPATASTDPRSLAIAQRGIKSGNDFADFMSALMTDIIDQRVSPGIGNAACNAGGKLLKIVEMQYKYGTTEENGGKVLRLAAPVIEELPTTKSG